MMAIDQMPGRLPSVHASDDPEKAPHLGGSVAVCELENHQVSYRMGPPISVQLPQKSGLTMVYGRIVSWGYNGL